ncbi:MAG: hypothetical protein AAFY88_02365 [Acidobacteriota bacterium]
MKHRIATTASVCLLLLTTLPAHGRGLSASSGESLIPFEQITAEGSHVPEVGRQFLDEDFFTRDMTDAFNNGQNYTASLTLPDRSVAQSLDPVNGLVHRTEVGSSRLLLYLTNLADAPNDIAISAIRAGGAVSHNGLIRVEPGERLGVSADALADFDELRILSIQDFAATAVVGRAHGKARELELDTTAPLAPRVDSFDAFDKGLNKSINYCQNKSNVIVEITNDSNGVGVLACAQRTFGSGTHYEYAINYPTCGDAFHCKTSGGSVFVNPACKMYSNTTRRCSNSSIEHNWQNLDEVVFSCGTGTAQCVRGCTGDFTITCP